MQQREARPDGQLLDFMKAWQARQVKKKPVPMPAEDFEALEHLVHEYGVKGLLECLSMMCFFQADFMRRMDEPETADEYEYDAILLSELEVKVI